MCPLHKGLSSCKSFHGCTWGWLVEREQARNILRKESTYCSSLDREVERLKDNINDYWHGLNTLVLHHINLRDLSVLCRLGNTSVFVLALKKKNYNIWSQEKCWDISPVGYWKNAPHSAENPCGGESSIPQQPWMFYCAIKSWKDVCFPMPPCCLLQKVKTTRVVYLNLFLLAYQLITEDNWLCILMAFQTHSSAVILNPCSFLFCLPLCWAVDGFSPPQSWISG